MRVSPLKDFHFAAQDYLQLIAKKSKQASVNSEAAKEMETLETFYEMITGLLSRCEVELHETKLLSVNEHVKAKILEAELKRAYNEVYKSGNTQLFTLLLKETVMPTRKELEEEVKVK